MAISWIANHVRNLWFLVWLTVSLIWIVGVSVFLPPVGAQINWWIFAFYAVGGPIVTAAALWLLHWIQSDFFSNPGKATPLGAVFLAVFALFGYLISAEREARRPFLEKQLETCSNIAGIVGTLSSTSFAGDRKRWSAANANFWTYYWGRLGMFEDSPLEHRMVQFGDMLIAIEPIVSENEFNDPTSKVVREILQQPSLCVAHTCREQAQVTWSVVPRLILSPEEEQNLYCSNADKAYSKLFSMLPKLVK